MTIVKRDRIVKANNKILQAGVRERPRFQRIVKRVDDDGLWRHCEVKAAHEGAITSIAMTFKGVHTAFTDGFLRTWTVELGLNGKYTLKKHTGKDLREEIMCLVVFAEWSFCGSVSGKIWGQSPEGEYFSVGHRHPVHSVIMHQEILISGSDGEIRFWKYQDNRFVCASVINDRKHMNFGAVNKLMVANNHLIVGGSLGVAFIAFHTLDCETHPRVQRCVLASPVVDMVEYMHHLLAAYGDGSLRVFDVGFRCKGELKTREGLAAIGGLESGPRRAYSRQATTGSSSSEAIKEISNFGNVYSLDNRMLQRRTEGAPLD